MLKIFNNFPYYIQIKFQLILYQIFNLLMILIIIPYIFLLINFNYLRIV